MISLLDKEDINLVSRLVPAAGSSKQQMLVHQHQETE